MARKIALRVVGDGYEVVGTWRYYSRRYNRSITIPEKMYSDGATWAPDLDTDGWVVHDHICRYAVWNDGVPIDNWTASTILADILYADGYKLEAFCWWWATYLRGGGAARKNGMRRVFEKKRETNINQIVHRETVV